MIEKAILDFLSEKLSVPVFLEKPTGVISDFVFIEKTGSTTENHMETGTFAVQSYGETLYKAAQLNDMVKSVMSDLTELTNIFSCSLNSDYNFTDTTTKKYRYQAVYDIAYMEV